MEKYKIATVCVSGATAVAIDLKPIPRGITGAVVEFIYDDDIWAGLRKKVAFRGSGEVEKICDGDTVIFPAEVAQQKNKRVTVGVTGVSEDGTVVIPTLWAELGTVVDSAYGDYPTAGEPVQPVWAQLLAMIGTLNNLNTEARESLVAAINEVLGKVGTGGGNVDLSGYVKAFNGIGPNEDGNVEIAIPSRPEDIGALPDTYTPPIQTAEQVGADPKGTAAAAVSGHNTSEESHEDLRLQLRAINNRLTAFFDSDDQTLDELSEIVAYITSNKTLIEAITTSKVSVADIVDNLVTNVANKPLSAAQGVVLKGLIDGLSAGKLDASTLQNAINDALAQAKASGAFDGEDGDSVTVKNVTESTEDGGSNVVEFSDGKTVTVRNGKAGTPGKTPVRGVDYWTPADQEAIVQQVIAALGTPVFGRVDENNNIILTGELAEGVYTLKYEDADGDVTEIGTLNHTNIPEPTNLADQTSVDWMNDKRINSSGEFRDASGWDITNFIAMSASVKKMHIKGLDIMSADSAGANYGRVYAYNGNKEYTDYKQPSTLGAYFYAADYDDAVTIFDAEAARTTSSMNSVTGAAYLRFGGMVTSDDVIITIDENIN